MNEDEWRVTCTDQRQASGLMVEARINKREKCPRRQNTAERSVNGAHNFQRQMDRAGILGRQCLQRSRPERSRQVVPAGIRHQVIHQAMARGNHIIEIAPGGEYLVQTDLKFGLR